MIMLLDFSIDRYVPIQGHAGRVYYYIPHRQSMSVVCIDAGDSDVEGLMQIQIFKKYA